MCHDDSDVRYAVAAQVLERLTEALRPFVVERYRQRYPDQWEAKLGIERDADAPLERPRQSMWDDGQLLTMMKSQWEEVFAPLFGKDRIASSRTMSLVDDVKAMRALSARHPRKRDTPPAFNDSDAWRLIDSTRRLLDALDLLDADTRADLDAQAARLEYGGSETARALGPMRERYLASVASRYEHLAMGALARDADGRLVQPLLRSIYVRARLASSKVSAREGIGPQADSSNATRELESVDRVDDVSNSARTSRILVVGEAGSGKSTLLRHIALCLATDVEPDIDAAAGRTPVLVNAPEAARALARGDAKSLFAFIGDRLTDGFGEVITADVVGDRAILLLDALDEIGDAQARTTMGSAIDRFASEHPGVPIIAASRPEGSRILPLALPFERIGLQPFDEDQVRSVVRAWHQALGPNTDPDECTRRADRLSDTVLSSPVAADLACRPLLLAVIVLTEQRGAGLPARRTELLKLATRTLLRDWPKVHGLELSNDELELVLGRVALHYLTDTQRGIGFDTLRSVVTAELATIRGLEAPTARRDAAEMVDLIEHQTGTIVEKDLSAAGESSYRFIHRSFAEYLAAVALLERYEAGEVTLDAFVLDPRLSETVALFFELAAMRAGRAHDAMTELLALDLPLEPHAHMCLRLALRLMGRGLKVTKRVRSRVLARAAEAVLTTRQLDIYFMLIDAIGEAADVLGAGTDPGPSGPPHGSPIRRAHLHWTLRGRNWTDLDARAAFEAIAEDAALARERDDPDYLFAVGEWLARDVVDAMGMRLTEADVSESRQEQHVFRDWQHSRLEESRFDRLLFDTSLSGDTWVSRALATRLCDVGVPICTIGDFVAFDGSPPGIGGGQFTLDFGDVAVVDLDDLRRLARSSVFSQLPKLVARTRTWSPEEIESAMTLLGERAGWRDVHRLEDEDFFDEEIDVVSLWEEDVVRAVCWPTRDSRVVAVDGRMPDWLASVIADRTTSVDGLVIEAVRTIPTSLAIRETWVEEFVAALLRHESPEVRINVAREVAGYNLGQRYREERDEPLPNRIIEALETCTEDEDLEVRSETLRALAATRDVVAPKSAMFLSGIATVPIRRMSEDLYGLTLRHLVHLASDSRWSSDGHIMAAQLGKMLDWELRPSPPLADVFFAGEQTSDRVPGAVAETLWSRTSAIDRSVRTWAANAWSWCARSEPATNELSILLGDSDPSVRLAGFHAILPVDLEDPTWLPTALEPAMRRPFEMFDHSGADPVPESIFEHDEFRRGFEEMLLRVLEDGAWVMELDFLASSLHPLDPSTMR